MADNTSYTSLFGHLIQEVKQYLSLQKEYVLMDTADKLIVILSSVAIAVVCFVLGAMTLFFLTFALAHWIGAVTDNVPLGFLCIALFHLAILVLFFRNRNKWIIQPLARAIVRLFVSKEETQEQTL